MGNTFPGLILNANGITDRKSAIKAGLDPNAPDFERSVAAAVDFNRRRIAGEREQQRKQSLLTGLGTTNQGNPRLG